MKVFIKEWRNRTASILTANGQVVWTFSSAAEAEQACRDWRSIVRTGGGDCHAASGKESEVCYCLV